MGSTLFSKRFDYQEGRARKNRSKTFKTEEAAKAYADANKIKNYVLKNLKSEESNTKKILIVEE